MPDLPLLPCLEPNDAQHFAGVLSAPTFAYDGRPFTLPEFVSYITTYDFGAVKPDQVVLHNTANPDASWAPLGTNTATWWDRDEGGMSPTTIRNKRQRQLDAIKTYYVSLGWNAGPHIFVDDRYIWLFTPMDTIGIHAKEGNSYKDAGGRLHYTLGVEVVGWYGKVGWPPAIRALLRGAIQALRNQLQTFLIVYKPAPAHQPAAHQGSIAFHRDYNKPECPGAKIVPDYAIPILKEVVSPPTPPSTVGFYVALAPMWISETPTPRGPIALQGKAVVEQGEVLDIDEVKNDFGHLRSGVGFLPIGGLRKT
jgi:hypothetical protein